MTTHVWQSTPQAVLTAEQVAAGEIKKEAVTNAKLEKAAAAPTFGGGKGQQVLTAIVPARIVNVALNAKETEKVYKIKHSLGQQLVAIQVLKTSTFAPMKLAKVTSLSANETEIEIEAVIADKEEFYVTLVG